MMIIDGSVIVCMGTFLRRAYEVVLTRYTCRSVSSAADCVPTYGEALEAACLFTLRTFCDLDMRTHAYRIANMAESVGSVLRLSQRELLILRIAALLHDIGKLGIPTTILYKPGMLDQSERACMQMHPQLGQRVLHTAGEEFQSFAPLIVAHHEFWDGSGYPYGLSGEVIPLLTRIITVVDAYDAMISLRIYRQPRTVVQAQQELLRCAGQQFDPRVVHAFLSLFDPQQAQQCITDYRARLLLSTSSAASAHLPYSSEVS
jgi:HD-GYP domain